MPSYYSVGYIRLRLENVAVQLVVIRHAKNIRELENEYQGKLVQKVNEFKMRLKIRTRMNIIYLAAWS